MMKESRTLSDAEIKALADAFDMTPEQFMSSIKAAESMLRREAYKKNKGGPVTKKKKKMNVGGMMPMNQKRKVNPTTGLSMNKGGMTDMRKTGMFYGGMARKK